jgi:hypothetical protein
VAENIYQKYTDGQSALDAAIKGTVEVIPQLVGSLATTALVAFFFILLLMDSSVII